MPPPLTIERLQLEASIFAHQESTHDERSLFGVTDGKAVGTYLEHKFKAHVLASYSCEAGNSASGIDFPELGVDVKVTSIRQPQSSCPFKNASQKLYGLGYSLLVFVYDKKDHAKSRKARLNILHTVFVEKERTADYQTTTGLRRILENNSNRDDVLAFFAERMLPLDEVSAAALADKVLRQPPEIGYLTVSNALQWRLQYSRVIEKAGSVEGILKLA